MDFDQTCTDTLIFGTAERYDEILMPLFQDLSNVVSARRFVGWYNGLPQDKHVSF